MYAKVIKRRLIFGFSVMLLLIVVTLIVGLTGMWSIESRLRVIVDENNVKTALITSMRNAISDRSQSLYKMLLLSNQIEVKQELFPYRQRLAEFKLARNTLMTMSLSSAELRVLKNEFITSRKAMQTQDQVVNLLLQEQIGMASQLLYLESLPKQTKLMGLLEELIQLQRVANNNAENEAQNTYLNALALSILFGGVAILFAAAVAVVVIRRTTQAETKLFREKERAQVTLHSIGDGVITTNADGCVDYLNDVAKTLTGYSQQQAKGRPLLGVFKLRDEHGRPPEVDPVQQAIRLGASVESDSLMTLKRNDDKQYAIEYTVAPIRDYDDSVSGTVVVFRNVTAIRNMMEQMVYQARHDSLTKLINRREFERQLDVALSLARDSDEEHALCYLDLDQFKVVNDSCGHLAGDELLKQLGQLLQKNVRRTDTLARIGGDEFAVLLRNCKLDKANQIIDELRRAMNDYRFVWDDKSFGIASSFGLVAVTKESGGIAELLTAADNACFRAKEMGRNRIHIYQPDDKVIAERRDQMQWLPRLRTALKMEQFKLYQQRIISLKNSESELDPESKQADHFYEILVRIENNGEIIPPTAFIPAAERYNLMPALDRWIVEHAFEHIQNFVRSYPHKKCKWTINLSGHTLCDDTFYGFVLNKHKKYKIDSSTVCFEVTETAAVSNMSSASTIINKLKNMGFYFALDDFGSGLSSFTYLKHLSVDYLKIDGSFVRDMATDPIDRAMVESINEIGHVMGLKTIAEYVEDAEALQCLKDIGVDFAQGFWLHEPEALPVLPFTAEKDRHVTLAD
ncbi:MAG: EAL domain-containing protein [Thiohalomonadales bacterium]